jgi:hypothetical protein
MSVKSEVLNLLREKEWVSVEDFELLFPPKTEGHISWGQRLRELRTDGYIIIKRRKENCKHTFEYHLVSYTPPSEPLRLFEDRAGQMAFIGGER